MGHGVSQVPAAQRPERPRGAAWARRARLSEPSAARARCPCARLAHERLGASSIPTAIPAPTARHTIDHAVRRTTSLTHLQNRAHIPTPPYRIAQREPKMGYFGPRLTPWLDHGGRHFRDRGRTVATGNPGVYPPITITPPNKGIEIPFPVWSVRKLFHTTPLSTISRKSCQKPTMAWPWLLAIYDHSITHISHCTPRTLTMCASSYVWDITPHFPPLEPHTHLHANGN